MTASYTRTADGDALATRAIHVRDECLGALARSAGHPAPAEHDLVNLPSDVGLREAWEWWRSVCAPPAANGVGASAAASTSSGAEIARRSPWMGAAITLAMATGLLLGWPASL